jgi:hypothetical protein
MVHTGRFASGEGSGANAAEDDEAPMHCHPEVGRLGAEAWSAGPTACRGSTAWEHGEDGLVALAGVGVEGVEHGVVAELDRQPDRGEVVAVGDASVGELAQVRRHLEHDDCRVLGQFGGSERHWTTSRDLTG